jgi:hypothetical protein
MRLVPAIVLSFLLGLTPCMCGIVQAEDEKNPQVNAATTDALETLKREVVTVHITPELTIANLLDQVGGNEEFAEMLRGAEQLGGARWLGDQAVQVRLSIDGSRVGKTLLKIIQHHSNKAPVAVEVLERELGQLTGRTFSATGTSTGAGDINCLRPPPADRAWWGVSDADRRAAVAAARSNAIDRVMQELAAVPIDGKSLNQAIAESGAFNAIKAWLEAQPVKAVEFDDNLSVRLTLAAPAEQLWPVLRSTIERQKQVPLPSTQAEWDQLFTAVAAHLTPTQGVGVVQPNAQPPVTPATLIPAQAPPWANQQVEAEDTSSDDGARLRTARRAEALALEKLRHQIDGLPLSGGMTLGAAAQQDPRIERSIVRALGRARPFKVDYGPKGSVTVHVAFRLSDLWAELSGQQ